MARKAYELIPSARRMITSLRDMGYDFATAVADVVDNSIEAKATRVNIDVYFNGDDSSVRIVDDGHGMSPTKIREALRYGAERDYDETEALGKFGLGLKTASMSQCQRLTVASRSSKERADIYAHAWDLNHVVRTDKWEILEVARSDQTDTLRDPLKEAPGTVVLWERLDRVLGFKHPYGEMAKKRLSAMCRELEQHLTMVFHRYMTGEGVSRRVKISLNGNTLKAWDPFARKEQCTQVLEPVTLAYDYESVAGDIIVQPYVLPHQDDFSTQQSHMDAAGPLRWNRQQGFYIYRANRMIQSGGWSNLRTQDEHTKLARVAISFTPTLDEAFRINVAKMRVQLPQQLREQFEKALGPVIRVAQAAYRRPNRKPPSDASLGTTFSSPVSAIPPAFATTAPRLAKKPANKNDLPSSDALLMPAGLTHSGLFKSHTFTFDELRAMVERSASDEERPVVSSVFARVLKEISGE